MRLIDADHAVEEIDSVFSIAGNMALMPVGITKAIVRNLLTLESITPTVGRWISVNERMPEMHTINDKSGEFEVSDDVLFITDGIITTGYTEDDGDGQVWVEASSGCPLPLNAVTYWMPIPEPPKEDAV